MRDNRPLLAELFEHDRIALNRSALFDAEPDRDRRRSRELWNRIEGMLLGLMIGDALGNTSESMLPSERRRHFAEIRDYLPNRHAEGRRVGLPSDDSQLAMWTLESLLEGDGLDPEQLADTFVGRRIFGIGNTVTEFLFRYRDERLPWYEAGVASAGNGALMRIAPVLVPHAGAPDTRLWADAAIAAMLTHNDRASTGSCVAFVDILSRLLLLTEAPAPEWWIDSFVAALSQLEGETQYRSNMTHDHYEGPLWRFVDTSVRSALVAKASVVDACDSWHSGAYLLETVPSVLYILARHGDDAEEAIVRAVNDTWDNDSIGAIVGAAVGALHGSAALPTRWIDGLLGRTQESDDGRAFDLIEQSRARWFAR